MNEASKPKSVWRAALTPTIVALGAVSLLTDSASDMIWPLLPLFLVEQLHRSVAYVGLIEGVAEATAAIGKYVAGRYSDRLSRRKPIVLLGYGLSSAMRPLLALATSPFHALGVRFADRVGKGIRTAPRDALLAANTNKDLRASVFGFHRAMDNLGAFIGPVAAAIFLAYRPGHLRTLFALSAIPGALAVLALALFVREPMLATNAPPPAKNDAASQALDKRFREYLAIVGLFTLSNASDFFLVAKAHDVGIPDRRIPLVWAGLSLLRALASTPGGRLADTIGRARSLSLGWALYAVAYAGFAVSHGAVGVIASTIVYAGYYGLTEGAERALVASFAPAGSLGRAYGAFALVTGLMAVPASGLFGVAYRVLGGGVAFGAAAVIAATASVALFAWTRRHR